MNPLQMPTEKPSADPWRAWPRNPGSILQRSTHECIIAPRIWGLSSPNRSPVARWGCSGSGTSGGEGWGAMLAEGTGGWLRPLPFKAFVCDWG